MSSLSPVADAKEFVKGPLGIIGLFTVLVYGLATISFSVENTLTSGQRWWLTVFIVMFPVGIFVGFLYLVIFQFHKLYPRSDFDSDEGWAAYTFGLARVGAPIDGKADGVAVAIGVANARTAKSDHVDDAGIAFVPEVLDDLFLAVHFGRGQRGIFLGHIVNPVPKKRQFEVAIFVTGSGDVSDVKSAEFYLGSGWRSKVFNGTPDREGRLGITVSAYNGFLALCRITFRDGTVLLLNHYCNIEATEFLVPKRPWINERPSVPVGAR